MKDSESLILVFIKSVKKISLRVGGEWSIVFKNDIVSELEVNSPFTPILIKILFSYSSAYTTNAYN